MKPMNLTTPMHPPRLLAILPGIDPTGVMYIIKPMLALERQGVVHFRLMLQPYFRPSDLDQVDLVLFCRNLDPRYAAILEAVQARRIPYTYDLDDDLFNVPAGTQDGAYFNHPDKAAQLERYLQSAALVRVYSAPLLARVGQYTDRAVQVSPLVDWALMQPLPQPLPQPPPPTADGPVKIVYATSRRDDYLFPLFAPALLELLQRYPGRVALYFWGFLPPDFAGLPGVQHLHYLPDYNRYLAAFARQGFEIGLAPLLDDAFHRSKTDTKFREYGASAIAGVYSNVSVYADAVQDGVTGLLVENTPAAWLEALTRLLEQPDLRRSIGQAAQRVVRQRYDPQHFHAIWLAHIRQVLAGGVPEAVAVVERPPAPASPPTAAPPGKLARLRQLLQQGGLRLLARQAYAHVVTIYWLFKINRLKRL